MSALRRRTSAEDGSGTKKHDKIMHEGSSLALCKLATMLTPPDFKAASTSRDANLKLKLQRQSPHWKGMIRRRHHSYACTRRRCYMKLQAGTVRAHTSTVCVQNLRRGQRASQSNSQLASQQTCWNSSFSWRAHTKWWLAAQ